MSWCCGAAATLVPSSQTVSERQVLIAADVQTGDGALEPVGDLKLSDWSCKWAPGSARVLSLSFEDNYEANYATTAVHIACRDMYCLPGPTGATGHLVLVCLPMAEAVRMAPISTTIAALS